MISHTICNFSYLMDPVGEPWLILLSFFLPSVVLSIIIRLILFVLHKCRNFLTAAQFCAAIVVFSARFCAVFCCFNFAFCWSTYVRLLSHLSLPSFVTFVYFTLRCQLFFIFRCHLFFLYKLVRFQILSLISPTWWNLLAKRRQFYVLLFFRLFFFKLLYLNTFRPT